MEWGFKTLTGEGSKWVNEEARVINGIDLKPNTKVSVKIV